MVAFLGLGFSGAATCTFARLWWNLRM